MPTAPIFVALDTPDPQLAAAWATSLVGAVRGFKVGLELFCRVGPEVVRTVRECGSGQLFLDLKLHDIPHTVAGAAGSVARLAPDFLTVHAAGGPAMIEAAATALPDTAITAVTVLTSLGAPDLASLGIAGTPEQVVTRWARQAVDAGARAIVCSPQEVAAVRAAVPASITLITPGVRPLGSAHGDQIRVATPEQAIASGADAVVIGRPITGAPDPRQAATDIARNLG